MRDLKQALPAPGPPGWHLDWEDLDREFAFIRALRGCPQDPIYHAEGDVWIHTRMVCEQMVASQAYREASSGLRARLFAAAVLHDVAKPRCTIVEDGRVRSPGHSSAGARDARQLLWKIGVGFAEREPVCAQIQHHQKPFHWAKREDSRRVVIELSQVLRLRELVWLAEADMRGRICQDQASQLDSVSMLAKYADELGCLDVPWPFANDHSRVMFFAKPDRDPGWAAFDDTGSTVTLMSGLPGSGKSTWSTANSGGQPVIELDAIRRELGVGPGKPQGKVIGAARLRAREYLRQRESFFWDATNLSRSVRRPLLSLLRDYGARIRIVYVEAPVAEIRQRNQARANPVPNRAIERMMKRWEPPDLTEAHELVIVETG